MTARSFWTRRLGWILAATLGVTPGVARAQSAADVAAARDLFLQGSRLSSTQDWVHAQERFERSLALKRAPITLFSLAVVETHRGHLVEALEHLRAFLAEPSAPGTKAYEVLAATEIAKLEARVGRCSWTIAPPSLPELSVSVDGQPIPAAAIDLRRLVNPGTHGVVASAKGWRGQTVQCTVGEGGSARVQLTLTQIPPEAEAAPQARLANALEPDPGPAAPNRAIPFGLVGAGGAIVIAGIGVGAAGLKQADSASTRNGADASSALTKGYVSDALVGVGSATLAVGLVVLIVQATQKPDPTRSAKARVHPTLRGFALRF